MPAFTHVMGTCVFPDDLSYRFAVGQFVYVHSQWPHINPLDALECVITDVSQAPEIITLYPCNHPTEQFDMPQAALSAPIMV